MCRRARNRLVWSVGCYLVGTCPVSRWIRPISHPRKLSLSLRLLSLHSIASQRNNGLIITAFQVNLEPHASEKTSLPIPTHHPVSLFYMLLLLRLPSSRPETMRKRHLLHIDEQQEEITTKGRNSKGIGYIWQHATIHTLTVSPSTDEWRSGWLAQSCGFFRCASYSSSDFQKNKHTWTNDREKERERPVK